MSWSTTKEPEAKPLSAMADTLLKTYGDKDKLLQAWSQAAADLKVQQSTEMALRLACFEILFPSPREGTNRTELGNGWAIKCVYPYSYKLDNKEAKTETAIDKIAEISQQAGFIADRLVKWDPELSTKEYRMLNPDDVAKQTDEQKKILALLQPILTIKPGSPQLELEPPKGK